MYAIPTVCVKLGTTIVAVSSGNTPTPQRGTVKRVFAVGFRILCKATRSRCDTSERRTWFRFRKRSNDNEGVSAARRCIRPLERFNTSPDFLSTNVTSNEMTKNSADYSPEPRYYYETNNFYYEYNSVVRLLIVYRRFVKKNEFILNETNPFFLAFRAQIVNENTFSYRDEIQLSVVRVVRSNFVKP